MSGGILLYGGTFDPIHNGHLIVCRAAAEKLGVEKVILIPSAVPPHKQDKICSAPQDRLALAQLAVEGEPLFKVCDCEMKRPGPSYTLDTVRGFQDRCGQEISLYWLIGADSIGELASWYKIEQLVQECTIVTAVRPGYKEPDFSGLEKVLSKSQIARLQENCLATPLIEISATDIRRRVARGTSIRYMTPVAVQDYIEKTGLYRDR